MDDSVEIRVTPDALIAMVVTEAEARELAAMPSIEKMNEEFHPSERFKQRMSKLLHEASRKSERERIGRGVKKGFVAVAAAISLFSCVMFPAPSVHDAVVSTLLDWKEKFVSIVFTKEDVALAELPQYVQEGYIPEGFILYGEAIKSEDRFYAQYKSPLGMWYSIRVVSIDGTQSINLDDEYSTFYTVDFQSHHAIWGIMKDGSNVLIWENSSLAFKVSGNISLDELIKIAEQIRISPHP